MNIKVEWLGNMLFSIKGGNGRYALTDSSKAAGGQNSAPTPKEMFLGGLAGCTGMDVVSILKKMRIFPESFDVDLNAELSEEHPKEFVSYELVYSFKGSGLENDVDKIEKAVKLSQERYCGVSATLAKTGPITYSVRINS